MRSMKGGRSYDIFPRTFKARLLLTIAFLAGGAMTAVVIAAFVFVSVSIELEPCYEADLSTCLEEQSELEAMASDSCDGFDRRICFVPLGKVSPGLVRHLVEHYEDEYGLTVTVLTPSAIPEELVDPEREQIDAVTLIEYMGTLFPGAYNNPDVVLIGLTPADLYNRESHFRFLFGTKGTPEHPKAVVSTYRMNVVPFKFPLVEGIMFSRARKLVTKYIGMLYYGLPPSDDPRSPLYDSILSVGDLDRMEEPLPVTGP